MIRAAALTAREQAETLAEASEKAARDELVAGARNAIAALPAPDGTTPLLGKLKDDGKTPAVHVDLAEALVVIDDGTAQVAARRADGRFELRLVQLVDGEWTRRSEPVSTLADLGHALTDGA